MALMSSNCRSISGRNRSTMYTGSETASGILRRRNNLRMSNGSVTVENTAAEKNTTVIRRLVSSKNRSMGKKSEKKMKNHTSTKKRNIPNPSTNWSNDSYRMIKRQPNPKAASKINAHGACRTNARILTPANNANFNSAG